MRASGLRNGTALSAFSAVVSDRRGSWESIHYSLALKTSSCASLANVLKHENNCVVPTEAVTGGSHGDVWSVMTTCFMSQVRRWRRG